MLLLPSFLAQVDLSRNRLCGIWMEGEWNESMQRYITAKKGSYNAEGIKSIADALVRASLTECNLRDNDLGKEGWCTIFDVLCDNPQNKIAKWDLSRE